MVKDKLNDVHVIGDGVFTVWVVPMWDEEDLFCYKVILAENINLGVALDGIFPCYTIEAAYTNARNLLNGWKQTNMERYT